MKKLLYHGHMRWFVLIVIACSLLFTVTVYASEGIISPLADSPDAVTLVVKTVALPANIGAQSSLGLAVVNYLNSTVQTPIPTPTVVVSTPTPTPTPPSRTTRKPQMTVTLLGDSMVDTLGPDGGGLVSRLNKIYPKTKFTVINHGVGGENIDSGLNRLTSGYTYLGEARPSVVSQAPDVIVVESFGYNPYSFDTGALEKHWLQLASVMNTIRNHLPTTKIVLAATIAPNRDVFGDGAPFINMSPEGKKEKVAIIDSYIESTIAFAKSEHYPLADAYHASRDSTGNGKLQYINGGDHIHYSDAGRALMSQTITDTITQYKLLE